MHRPNVKDFAGWNALSGLRAGVPAAGTRLSHGSARRMGPGYFPQLLSLLLIAIGVATALRALLSQAVPVGSIALKALLLLSLAVVAFGFTCRARRARHRRRGLGAALERGKPYLSPASGAGTRLGAGRLLGPAVRIWAGPALPHPAFLGLSGGDRHPRQSRHRLRHRVLHLEPAAIASSASCWARWSAFCPGSGRSQPSPCCCRRP